MPQIPLYVTETELAILQVLWDQGEATRPLITATVYPDGGPAQYATVQKLLERLEAKGFVRSVRHKGKLSFTATLARAKFLDRRLQSLAEKVCGGSLTPLLLTLVRSSNLTPAELDELRAVIEERRQQRKPKGKSR
jgi:BlaI family transcriptional regulator, penicillinase repressor